MTDGDLTAVNKPRPASPLRATLAATIGLVTTALLVIASGILYSILGVHGNLEGEPWQVVVVMMIGAAITATIGMALWKPRASPRLLLRTFLTVALIGLVTFGILMLQMSSATVPDTTLGPGS